MKTALLRKTDMLLGPLACGLCSLAGLPATAIPRTAPLELDQFKHIVIIRPGGMGDMVVLLPMLRQLTAALPAARITVVCEQRNLGILDLADLPIATLCYDSQPYKTVATLRHSPIDLAIDAEQFHNFSAVLAYLSGAPVRIGFNINPRRNPLYTHLVPYSPDGAETEQFAKLLGPLNLPGLPPPLHRLLCTLHLPTTNLPALPEKRYVIMQPGTAHRYKQWGVDHYIAVARALSARGLDIVLTGGPHDRDVADRIARGLRDRGSTGVNQLAGQLELRQSSALLQRAALYVGTDTGMAHLAVALDTPGVVLFGPSDPQKWAHRNAAQTVVSAALPCSPCFLFGYHKPCRTRPCMQQISPAQVIEACTQQLSATT